MQIEFYNDDKAIVEFFPPRPANKVIPDWYKELPMHIVKASENINVPTIKHCMPVQDMITSGYIIFNPYETHLIPNKNHLGYDDFLSKCPHKPHVGGHHHLQLPLEIQGKNNNYFKIGNSWIVRTPPGYSCLFVQPFYQMEERFQMLPAIVDTDRHDMTIEFPGYLLTDKPVILQPGDPLMQVIPFKRDDWEMVVEQQPKKRSLLEFYWESAYRRVFHSKKLFK